ncbi:jg19212 [Pararge aegeria aegeria]|uniref:Jg19212 protein n=1 Tax=Pararge aegeria aegeria TaxID=348720 RepID=A0A8S4SPV4_9NEOP|nr:jg19212 [Pararge aegeria aegeria]
MLCSGLKGMFVGVIVGTRGLTPTAQVDGQGGMLQNEFLSCPSSSSSACGSGSPGPWCHVDWLRCIVTPLSRSPSKPWSPPGIAALFLL